MKVLACAYACNPFRGSEEGVGWGWVNALARRHEVWVLTAAYHRRDFEEALRRHQGGRLHPVYVREKPWHYRPVPLWIGIENSLVKPIMNWAYRLWLSDAYAEALELHRAVRFDLAHQVTYVGFRFPGHLWKLGIPFVWGPIGGLENTPWRLLPAMGVKGVVYYGCRNIVNSMHRRFLRSPRKAFAAAGCGVVAATSGIQHEIQRWYGVDSQVICEVGLPPQAAPTHSTRKDPEPLRIAWSGRHLPGKALHLLLRALSCVPSSVDWKLHIYGDGPSGAGWKQLARDLKIDAQCTWHGQVSRADALKGLRSAHLFVTTSLKDLTSTVILEALANGVPVICPDHCGFTDVVNGTCGIKIPITNIRPFEDGLSRWITTIAHDETLRHRLAQGALARAGEFSWEAKAEAIERVYARVLRAGRDRRGSMIMTTTEAPAHSY